ncbi:MAG: hypothetical protein Q4B50_02075 [Bacillota bacterium]|nr:hypothetical protein [Bacillota bacterium]
MDQKTLAYINLFAVLGSLEFLCKQEPAARQLIEGEKLSIGFSVKNGPRGTLWIEDGSCCMRPGLKGCQVLLPFSSCEKFNGMIEGSVKPVPVKGFHKISFLLKKFSRLTDLLTLYLRPEPEKLQDEAFFCSSTRLMLHLIVSAIAQVGNADAIGRCSAGYMQDGSVLFSVKEDISCGIRVAGHQLSACHEKPEDYRAYMEFSDLHLARRLFDGQVNAVACVGQGKIRIGGQISQVDNLNRILDRVALYLA